MSTNQVAREQLRSVVERVERLDEEIKALNADKSDIYKEAKSNGFDAKALREVVRLRRKDSAERAEFESLVDLYKHALGMLPADAPEALARARVETIEEFDPDTGEVEPDQTASGSQAATPADDATTAHAVRAADESTAPIQVAEPFPDLPTFLQRGHPDCVLKA